MPNLLMAPVDVASAIAFLVVALSALSGLGALIARLRRHPRSANLLARLEARLWR